MGRFPTKVLAAVTVLAGLAASSPGCFYDVSFRAKVGNKEQDISMRWLNCVRQGSAHVCSEAAKSLDGRGPEAIQRSLERLDRLVSPGGVEKSTSRECANIAILSAALGDWLTAQEVFERTRAVDPTLDLEDAIATARRIVKANRQKKRVVDTRCAPLPKDMTKWDGTFDLDCSGDMTLSFKNVESRSKIVARDRCKLTLTGCTLAKRNEQQTLTAKDEATVTIVDSELTLPIGALGKSAITIRDSRAPSFGADVGVSDQATLVVDKSDLKGKFSVSGHGALDVRDVTLAERGQIDCYRSGRVVATRVKGERKQLFEAVVHAEESCRVSLVDSDLSGRLTLWARDKAVIEIQGGRIQGERTAVWGEGESRIENRGAKIDGPTKAGPKASLVGF